MDKREIIEALAALGLKQGDIVLLHSSLASIGSVNGGADTVVDAFLDLLGKEGTLVVPTFGSLGIITEVVRQKPGAWQSIHPKASLAAIGAKAEEVCRDHWKAETAHGKDTPYLRIAELNGYVCLLGVDQDRNTTLHSVEELLQLPYLNPTDEVEFETPEGPVRKSWPWFPGPHRDFIGLDRLFRNSGLMRTGKVGNAIARLIRSRDLLDLALPEGRKNPAFVLCDNPECADCLTQRAVLDRERFMRESFSFACSTGAAGRYVPEMIENTRAVGIDTLEIDQIQGMPLPMISSAKLAAAIAEFRSEGCDVSGFRLNCITEIGTILKQMKENRISRLIMPISRDAASFAEQSRQQGIAISFANIGISSRIASEILLDLKKRNISCGFTFNPAEFAMAGEKPFLFSYKQKLRRFIDQLDLEDVTFSGVPTSLARGNGEVKEMISILRCAGFDGTLMIGTRNRTCGTLKNAVERLKSLLDSM